MKNVFLVLMTALVTVPAMAFEKASVSYYDSMQSILCPGAYGEEKTYCAGGVLASGMLTFSPTTIALSPFILTAELSESNLKVILEAKEDASYFVASDGEIRTPKLERAIQAFHQDNPKITASDVEIAAFILAL